MHRSHKNQAALPRWQARRNALIARRRAAVERVFGTLKRLHGLARARCSTPCPQPRRHDSPSRSSTTCAAPPPLPRPEDEPKPERRRGAAEPSSRSGRLHRRLTPNSLGPAVNPRLAVWSREIVRRSAPEPSREGLRTATVWSCVVFLRPGPTPRPSPLRGHTGDHSKAAQPPLPPLGRDRAPPPPLPSGRGALHLPVEAGAPARVAAAAVPGDADLEQEGVLVAIDPDLDDASGSGRSSRPCARARRASGDQYQASPVSIVRASASAFIWATIRTSPVSHRSRRGDQPVGAESGREHVPSSSSAEVFGRRGHAVSKATPGSEPGVAQAPSVAEGVKPCLLAHQRRKRTCSAGSSLNTPVNWVVTVERSRPSGRRASTCTCARPRASRRRRAAAAPRRWRRRSATVMVSCVCRRRAKMSTTRASLDSPTTPFVG